MPGRAVQYYDVAGYLVGRPAGAFTLFITIVSLMSTSEHLSHFPHYYLYSCTSLSTSHASLPVLPENWHCQVKAAQGSTGLCMCVQNEVISCHGQVQGHDAHSMVLSLTVCLRYCPDYSHLDGLLLYRHRGEQAVSPPSPLTHASKDCVQRFDPSREAYFSALE